MQGVVWGLCAAAASAVPRYTYQSAAPKDEQILEIVQRIDERLDAPPVMQQTNNVTVPLRPGEVDTQSLALKALARIQERDRGETIWNAQRDAVLHAGRPAGD